MSFAAITGDQQVKVIAKFKITGVNIMSYMK